MQTSSPPVITPNRSQSNPDDMITLPRPIRSVGMDWPHFCPLFHPLLSEISSSSCKDLARGSAGSKTPGVVTISRALSLRNLVSGYECGRVFPAGVGPGSPSRDAANWLPSRSDLSVETRRQYGWLRMVFSGVRLFRAPIWWPSGGWRHARGREHCRGEPGGSLSGGYAPDSAKAEGSSIVDEPGEG